MDEARQARLALNEARLRAFNERQVDATTDFHDGEPVTLVVSCECSRPECDVTLDLAPRDYEHVRSSADWFALVPGHEEPEIERVVEVHDTHLVVEKLGVGAEVARETQ